MRDAEDGKVVRVDIDGKDGNGGPATLVNVGGLVTGVIKLSSSSASITVSGTLNMKKDIESDLHVRNAGWGTV